MEYKEIHLLFPACFYYVITKKAANGNDFYSLLSRAQNDSGKEKLNCDNTELSFPLIQSQPGN